MRASARTGRRANLLPSIDSHRITGEALARKDGESLLWDIHRQDFGSRVVHIVYSSRETRLIAARRRLEIDFADERENTENPMPRHCRMMTRIEMPQNSFVHAE